MILHLSLLELSQQRALWVKLFYLMFSLLMLLIRKDKWKKI